MSHAEDDVGPSEGLPSWLWICSWKVALLASVIVLVGWMIDSRRAKKRFQEALKFKLKNRAPMAPPNHHEFKRQLKGELMHSRLLRLAPFWKSWSKWARASPFFCQRRNTRAAGCSCRGTLFEIQDFQPPIAGDLSAWDSSWSPELNQVSSELDMGIYGAAYSSLGKTGIECSKAFTSRHARMRVEALHCSGDSDNTGSNGDLNLCIVGACLEEFFRISLDDPQFLVLVEGDDILVAHPGLQSDVARC